MDATTLILLLLLLACPLMMVFMHRGGGHGSHTHGDDSLSAPGADGEPAAPRATHRHGGCGHGGSAEGARHDHTKGGTPA
jgi:Protein of unknown function (DUF2933)